MVLRLVIMIWTILMAVLPMAAQQMSIEGFARQKESLVKDIEVKKEKRQAVLLLTTDEKGFAFKADGKTDVEAEEGDGLLTLKVPHKTQHLTVTHPDYGQLMWRVPEGRLKKKRTYHAYLQTYNPDKTYKLQKQWVVFQVTPHNAIVHVDSMLTLVRDGQAQYFLPIGKHPYLVESPFHEAVEDTLELTEAEKLILPVRLQPAYSYLTVRTPYPSCQIYLDNQFLGKHEAVSSHLSAGNHRLSVFVDDSTCYYDQSVNIGLAEKKVITLAAADLREQPWRENTRLSALATPSSDAKEQPAAIKAQVTIKAPDDETEILLNRELVGSGTWEGELAEGFYIINTRKDNRESSTRYLTVDDEFPKEVSVGTPQVDLGYLSIHSNVMGANVYVNDSLRGITPCIVENLPAGKSCVVRLEYPTYRPARQEVRVLGNDMVDVEIKMNKRKHEDE